MKCQHANRETVSEGAFNHCVASHPYTDCNPAAHGGLTYKVVCRDCKAERYENGNWRHNEVGTWWDPSAPRPPAYTITWSPARGGHTIQYDSLAAAKAAVRVNLPHAVIGHDGDLDDGGNRTLFWVDGAQANGDAGARAAGAIRRVGS